MPIFEVQGPDGNTYEVDAPDVQTAAGAFQSERQQLQAQGAASVQKSMSAEPEYVEVPILSPDGSFTGETEKVLKPSNADPIGRAVMNIFPFGEDLGALSRSMSSGRTLAQEKMMMEGERAAAQQAYPGAYRLGQAAGIVPQLYIPMGLAAKGTSMLGRTALGAAEGALYGGVTGLGEGVTAEERLHGAKTGATVGGLLGGFLGRFAGPAEQAATVVPESVNAAERLGVDLPRYATTDSPVLQQLTKISENAPLAGEPVIAAREKAVQGLQDAVDSLLPPTTTEQAGSTIGQGLKGWMTAGSKKDAAAAYDEVKSLFNNPDVTAPLNETTTAVSDIMAKRAQAGMQGTPPEIKDLLGAITRPEGLDYDSAKYLLSNFRTNYVSNPFNKTINQAEIKNIYQALRNDVLDIAEQAGGEPARFFLQKADQQYAATANMREKLQKIVGKTDEAVSDEQIFNRLYNAARSGTTGNNNILQRAIYVMPPEGLQALQAGILSKMGRDAQGNFSPDRWLGQQGFSGLSDRAKAMIFKDQPQLLQALNDITAVSQRFNNLNKYGNPSGTGKNVLGLATFGGLMKDPVSTIAGLVGGNVFTRIMSQPQTAQSIANWSQRYENYVRTPTRATANALYTMGVPVSRALSSAAGKNVDLNKSLGINQNTQ